MESRPRTRSFTWLEEAGFRLRHYGPAWLAVLSGCALFAGLLLLLQRASDGPETAEPAEILRFGRVDSRWRDQPVVVVRTGDGRLVQVLARRQALRHCRRGDQVTLVRSGKALFLHPDGCRAR